MYSHVFPVYTATDGMAFTNHVTLETGFKNVHFQVPGTIKEHDSNFTDFAAYLETFSNDTERSNSQTYPLYNPLIDFQLYCY